LDLLKYIPLEIADILIIEGITSNETVDKKSFGKVIRIAWIPDLIRMKVQQNLYLTTFTVVVNFKAFATSHR